MTAEEKARRYLTDGRLTVTRLSAGVIVAECRGSDTVYNLGYAKQRGGWRCTCEASAQFGRRCSHLIALQLVTVKPA